MPHEPGHKSPLQLILEQEEESALERILKQEDVSALDRILAQEDISQQVLTQEPATPSEPAPSQVPGGASTAGRKSQAALIEEFEQGRPPAPGSVFEGREPVPFGERPPDRDPLGATLREADRFVGKPLDAFTEELFRALTFQEPVGAGQHEGDPLGAITSFVPEASTAFRERPFLVQLGLGLGLDPGVALARTPSAVVRRGIPNPADAARGITPQERLSRLQEMATDTGMTPSLQESIRNAERVVQDSIGAGGPALRTAPSGSFGFGPSNLISETPLGIRRQLALRESVQNIPDPTQLALPARAESATIPLSGETFVPPARGPAAPQPSEFSLVVVTPQNPLGERLIFTGPRALNRAAIELGQMADRVAVLPATASGDDVARAARQLPDIVPPGAEVRTPITRFQEGQAVRPRQTQRQLSESLDPEDLNQMRRTLRSIEHRISTTPPGPKPNSPMNMRIRALEGQAEALRTAIRDTLAPTLPNELSIPGVIKREPVERIFPSTQTALPAGQVAPVSQPSIIAPGTREITQGREILGPRQIPFEANTAEEATRLRTAVKQRGIDTTSKIQDARQAAAEADSVASTLDNTTSSTRATGEPTGAGMPSPNQPEVALADDFEYPTWESPTQRVFAKWTGARNLEGLKMQVWFREGEDLIKKLGFKTDRETMEPVFRALHGEIPPNQLQAPLRRIFEMVKDGMATETRDHLGFLGNVAEEGSLGIRKIDADNFAQKMMANPDYFPRGWKRPDGQAFAATGRGIGTRPGFTKPRNDLSFSDMLEQGWEPLSWNPFSMMAERRLSGVQYRETVTLVNRLKTLGKVLPAREAPEGWRVPQVGPVFEGRSLQFPNGKSTNTPRLAVPNADAKMLENIFGRRASITGLKEIADWSNRLKRIKFIGSFFQHFDFGFRALGTAASPTSVLRGGPLKTPSLMANLMKRQWSPGARNALEADLAKGITMFEDGAFKIDSTMLIEEGWEIRGDIRLIEREFTDTFLPQLANTVGGRALEPIRKLQRYFEDGLFKGVYRETQKWALENFIIPQIHRTRPNATARQVAAEAAESVNIMFSTLGPWQSIVKDPNLIDASKVAMFSMNESESLLRGFARASSTLPQAGLFREWYLGMFISMGALANVINLAATGELMPLAGYSPLQINDPYGPFKVGYNDKFLSPIIPGVKGKVGNPLHADLVGQMDTAFRWGTDPLGAFMSRVNVVPRAAVNQIRGKTFFGQPLGNPIRPEDSLTQKEIRGGKTKLDESLESLRNRAVALGIDLFSPISGTGLLGALAQSNETAGNLIPEGEQKLGVAGQLIQSSGINLRAGTVDEILRERDPNYDNLPTRTRKQRRDRLIDEIYGE